MPKPLERISAGESMRRALSDLLRFHRGGGLAGMMGMEPAASQLSEENRRFREAWQAGQFPEPGQAGMDLAANFSPAAMGSVRNVDKLVRALTKAERTASDRGYLLDVLGEGTYNIGIPKPRNFEEFISSYRGDRGFYDPRLSTATRNELVSSAGEVVGAKDIIQPNPGLIRSLSNDPVEGLMFRGMSADEYQKALEQGFIRSMGDYNFSNQQGLTYFADNPGTASSYATGFAPWQYGPLPDKPAYVVAARRAPSERIKAVPGVGSNELGVVGATPLEDLVNVFRGDVYSFSPGNVRGGSFFAPTAQTVWSKVQ